MNIQLKTKLIDMLNYLDRVCEENGLRYYAIGGTFLGAIRHKGFIPWDNDIDVAMPRKDYYKFAEIVNADNSKYTVETPQSSSKDYLYSVAKLYDTTTTLIEKKKVKVKRGVYIDVFPMDGIADTSEAISANYKKIDIYNKIFAARTCAVRQQRSWWKNLAIIIVGALPEKLLSSKKLLMELDKMCAKEDFDAKVYVGVLLTQYGIKYIMPRSLFDESSRYQFEDTTIVGVSDYDRYLTMLFGDWHKLPPIEKRVEGHDYIFLDLEKSYLEGNNEK